MHLPARILLVSLCLAGISRSEVLEIRTLKTSRTISSAIKTNLDGGTLPTDRFEATYEKLASERKIDEISRFHKPDASSASMMTFETIAPSSKWKTLVEAELTFTKEQAEGTFHAVVSTPGRPSEPPSIQTISTISLEYGRWHVISEMNFGTDLVMTLVKITGDATNPFPEQTPVLAIEGYLVPMKEIDAENASRLAPDKIEALANKLTTNKEVFDSFRYPAMSGQKSMISKVGDKHPGYKEAGSGQLAARIESETTLSPDGKWAYLHIQSVVEEVDSAQNLPAYANRFEDTLPVGTWKAIPAERHPAGESTLLLFKVSHLRADRWKPKTLPPQAPLASEGNVTRTYTDIHPSIATKLSGGTNQQSIKDLLVRNGIPDGGWSATMVSNRLIVGRADVSIHKRIEALLADFTWTKEIAKKSGTPQ